MIAAMVRGSGGSVGMGCVDMQVRRIVIFALGHDFLHLSGSISSLASEVFHFAFECAEQSCTSPSECFKRFQSVAIPV
jgi:hypothetical protein